MYMGKNLKEDKLYLRIDQFNKKNTEYFSIHLFYRGNGSKCMCCLVMMIKEPIYWWDRY